MASVSFALNNRQWAALEEHRYGDESLNLAAKRLFLGVLDAPEPTETDRLDGEISDLKERLQIGIASNPDRLDKLEERLGKIEQKFSHISPPDLDPPPAPPSRLPKATRRQPVTPTPTID